MVKKSVSTNLAGGLVYVLSGRTDTSRAASGDVYGRKRGSRGRAAVVPGTSGRSRS